MSNWASHQSLSDTFRSCFPQKWWKRKLYVVEIKNFFFNRRLWFNTKVRYCFFFLIRNILTLILHDQKRSIISCFLFCIFAFFNWKLISLNRDNFYYQLKKSVHFTLTLSRFSLLWLVLMQRNSNFAIIYIISFEM